MLKGFPVKLLLIEFPISEFLALGFARPGFCDDDDLFESTAMAERARELEREREREMN